jgi:hypothetical protein
MASGTPDREGRFIEVGQGFLGVLLGSRTFLVLRWMTPEMVLEYVATRRLIYLAAKPSHLGVDVDELSCPCAVLPPIGVRLECRVPCLILFFFTWLPSFS